MFDSAIAMSESTSSSFSAIDLINKQCTNKQYSKNKTSKQQKSTFSSENVSVSSEMTLEWF